MFLFYFCLVYETNNDKPEENFQCLNRNLQITHKSINHKQKCFKHESYRELTHVGDIMIFLHTIQNETRVQNYAGAFDTC